MAGSLDIAAGDIGTRRTAIEGLISNADETALDKAIDFASDFGVVFQKHQAIVISAEFSELRRSEKRGAIASDEAQRRRRNLLFEILDLLEEIVSEYQRKLTA